MSYILKKISSSDLMIWNDVCYAIEKKDFEELVLKISNLEEQDKAYSFWVWDNKNNSAVAFVQLFQVLRFPSLSAAIEINVAQKFQNQGIGKKSIALLEKFAFEELGLLKLIAPISPDNLNSIKLFSSLGYEKIFDDPYAYLLEGKPVLHSIFVKLSSEVQK